MPKPLDEKDILNKLLLAFPEKQIVSLKKGIGDKDYYSILSHFKGITGVKQFLKYHGFMFMDKTIAHTQQKTADIVEELSKLYPNLIIDSPLTKNSRLYKKIEEVSKTRRVSTNELLKTLGFIWETHRDGRFTLTEALEKIIKIYPDKIIYDFHDKVQLKRSVKGVTAEGLILHLKDHGFTFDDAYSNKNYFILSVDGHIIKFDKWAFNKVKETDLFVHKGKPDLIYVSVGSKEGYKSLDKMLYGNGNVAQHANGDKLDYRDENTEVLSLYQYLRQYAKSNSTSKYFGVVKVPRSAYTKKEAWEASSVRPLRKYIGTFDTELEAAIAVNIVSLENGTKQEDINQLDISLNKQAEIYKELQEKYALGTGIQQTVARQGVGKLRNKTSKYVGVSWNSVRKKWQAEITKEGKKKYLGRFITDVEAAIAYNTEALKLYGQHAKLNKID